MAATQTEGRGASTDTKGAGGGGGISLETKMLVPVLLLLAVLSLFPFFYIIWMSLNIVSLINGITFDFAGLTNWTRMFTDEIVGAAWARAALYFVATVGLEMILGIAIALLVHELVWGKNLVLSLILLPMFMAPVIVGLLGRFLTDSSYGLYAFVLRETGIFERDILGTASSAMPAVILMDVWEWTPLIVLIVLAGLASVNQYVIEAAKVDGAGYLERLRYIVAPSIAGVVIVALLVRSMDAIRYFDIITVTTNGGPGNTTKIIPIRLYETAFRFFDLGYAAAIGLGMLVFSILVANVFVRILESRGLAK
ncbi:MAG: ABC transporter, permease protein 1 (cluster 1, maltose/g3p/polyamine/iron) [uncultured Rubrobacteraceae bacterium]|uniref:ABC transporter, permease protein 1 (Cluster 1, maltose/g3p/polyamine/iron) n=1 Tax=uncultured Rubrobacteraceae bacterium TaxID=349277 RepID=A0A6J4R8B1_9ACTN|nr:MAG: ABC transporter, permease protein 1 (cluster 1, maltose/g3p/polyamine/iron) [uncultured Rubrobacteraceae bacterium]